MIVPTFQTSALKLGDAVLAVGGIQNGVFTIPIPGSGVWVEFEQGDPDYPIWVGCFWGTPAEVPALARLIPPAVPGLVYQTPLQNGIAISDVPGPTGGIMLKSTTGAMNRQRHCNTFKTEAPLHLVGPR